MKFCNVVTLIKLSNEIPSEYLNQNCAIVEIIKDSANVLFDDESLWFVRIDCLEFSILDYK